MILLTSYMRNSLTLADVMTQYDIYLVEMCGRTHATGVVA